MTSLTNADFRSLLNTSDQSVLSVFTQTKKKGKTSLDEELKREKRKQKYLRLQKGQSNQKEGESVIEEGGYRDRASERRKCVDEVYQKCADELNEMKLRSIDESKFLGGDIEHTHLVKGLDFALLSKIRNELDKLSQNEKLREDKENRLSSANRLRIFTLLGRLIFKEMYEELHPHSALFNHKLNKIQNFLLRKAADFQHRNDSLSNDKWRRVSYIFDLNFNSSSNLQDDIPVLQLNSKESFNQTHKNNCSNALSEGNGSDDVYSFVPYLHKSILDELTKVMDWHLENRKRKKGERLARRVEENNCGFALKNAKEGLNGFLKTDSAQIKAAKNLVNEDDDIFVGAGGLDVSEILDQANKEESEKEKKKRKVDFDDTVKEEEKESIIDKEMKEKTREKAKESQPFKEDIIREEEGMEVEEEEQVYSAWTPQAVTSYPHVLPSADASTATTVYGLAAYPYTTQIANLPNNSNISYRAKTHIDTNAIPYVSTEPPKLIKSGTTTIDQDKGFYSVFKRDDAAFLKRGKEDVREKDPSFISDTYMECYPGFGAEVSFEAYSDDDEDRSKMDMGRQKQLGAKHKHQFKNENDWESYQLRKEALPKAAFQYGRKMDDNRVTRRRKKLNTEEEWKKIEKMIGDTKARTSKDSE